MRPLAWIAKLFFAIGFALLGFGVYLLVLLVSGKGGIPGFFGIIALFSNVLALAVAAPFLGAVLWFVSRRKRVKRDK